MRPVPGTMGAATLPLLPPRCPTNLSSWVVVRHRHDRGAASRRKRRAIGTGAQCEGTDHRGDTKGFPSEEPKACIETDHRKASVRSGVGFL
jgi:hypothetical protein